MKMDNVMKGARDVGRRNTLLIGILALSAAANLGQAVALVSARQTILVPTLTEELTLSGGGVSRDYLERLARDTTFVFLNRSPQTEEFFDKQVERLTTPETYREIKTALISERLQRQESRASQVFYPNSIYVSPKELYVEVNGRLETMNTREIIKSEDKSYGLTFERQGSLVLLRSFVPLAKNEEKGANVRPKQESDLQQ
ncbi:TraE/TraK family type IV conjugative transfer system protein [Brevundimonas naejangsanensis]|uniref:TraE/TraK family type IV conjugative transfer system protein n=1 Tax=Brevundimonas naejangsanensis TaxID=588932 RepID=UPI003D03EC2E